MALAEKHAVIGVAVFDRGGNAILVETCTGAHLAGGGEVHHQHAHGTVGLRLQDETATALQGGAKQDGTHPAREGSVARGVGWGWRGGVLPTPGPSRTTRPRRSSVTTSKGMTVSSTLVAEGAREGMAISGRSIVLM